MLPIDTPRHPHAFPPWQWLRGQLRRVCVVRGQVRREILAPAIAAARASHSRFGRPIAFVLSRSLLVVVERLPMSGFTWPLLPTNLIAPLILLDKALVDAALAERRAAAQDVNPATFDFSLWRRLQPPILDQYKTAAKAAATEFLYVPLNPAQRRLAEVLLHEALHHCGVVWPEWRNWVNSFARRVLFFIRWRDRRFPVFPYARIYGVGVNSADTLAARILEEADSRR
jgi:hypothetical protein